MADDRFCRHSVQFVVNGYTMIDGVMSASAIDYAVNGFLRDMEAPPIFLEELQRAKKGYHYAVDISINGGIAMFEVTTLSEAQQGGSTLRIENDPKH